MRTVIISIHIIIVAVFALNKIHIIDLSKQSTDNDTNHSMLLQWFNTACKYLIIQSEKSILAKMQNTCFR